MSLARILSLVGGYICSIYVRMYIYHIRLCCYSNVLVMYVSCMYDVRISQPVVLNIEGPILLFCKSFGVFIIIIIICHPILSSLVHLSSV